MYNMITYIDKSNLRKLKVDFVDNTNSTMYMFTQNDVIKIWFNDNFNIEIIKIGYYGKHPDRTGIEYVMKNNEHIEIAIIAFKLEFC